MKYLQGNLTVKERGTMTNIAEKVPGCNNQSLQQFISNSPWDEEGLIKHIQQEVAKLIGNNEKGSIHLDESGFPKQGNDSAGAKRQYCGRLGKVENCQVGVFLSYANGNRRTLIDKRLYIPEDRINDPDHRKRCKIPDDLTFKTKAELGLEMLLAAKSRNIPFSWVGMDCHYGEQPWFLDELETEGFTYIADTPCDTRLWITRPDVGVPQKNGIRGRNPTIVRVIDNNIPIRVDKLADELDTSQWHKVFLRDSERKEIWCQLACLRVYPVRDSLPGNECWLVIRRNECESETKYQFSNAPPDTRFEKLGEMSCSRYWIERAIQDGKGEAGLADYEVRGYVGWNHHMAMTFLAMLFLLEMQDEWKSKAPLLTLTDVRRILEVVMPQRKMNDKVILDLIEQKHMARYSAKLSHHKRGR
jgi:SRSO17 transposase